MDEKKHKLILEYIRLLGESKLQSGLPDESRLNQIKEQLDLSSDEILEEGRKLLLKTVQKHS